MDKKEARNTYQKQYIARIKKDRFWVFAYRQAKSRCNAPNSRYAKRGIKCLITLDEIKSLWFRDKAWKLKEPSLDRINGTKNYTLDNCRFIELKNNYRIRTFNNCPKHRPWRFTTVRQFNANGKFIKEWKGLITIERTLGISRKSISQSIRKGWRGGGFYWEYAKSITN